MKIKRKVYFLVAMVMLNILMSGMSVIADETKENQHIAGVSNVEQQQVKSSGFKWIILSSHSENVDIGDEFYIIALTSTGKKPTFKSSNSSVASVNTYGKVIAKKNGSALITAKITGAEASCRVTVRKTKITLNSTGISLQVGGKFKVKAKTSNGSDVKFRTSKKSIVTVDEYGNIEAKKPGDAEIIVKADTTEKNIRIKVLAPVITLSKSNVSLFRNESFDLMVKTSSGRTPTFKSNRSTVATVDENGKIKALKNGTALITVKLDGVSRICVVNVKKPVIELKKYNYEIKKGDKVKIEYKMDSVNKPAFSSSNTSVLRVNGDGVVTGLKKGKAYVYLSEDGVKVKCAFEVRE